MIRCNFCLEEVEDEDIIECEICNIEVCERCINYENARAICNECIEDIK